MRDLSWAWPVDKLIHYVNQDGRINAFYSTPVLFAEALSASNVTWTVKVCLGSPSRGMWAWECACVCVVAE